MVRRPLRAAARVLRFRGPTPGSCAAAVIVAALAGASGCGGKAIIDTAGAAGATGSTTSATTSTTSTTTKTCASPSDCPGAVCIFATGTCAPACNAAPGGAPCGAGLVCNECATGSCPSCLDCVAACMPALNGACDNHDDCGANDLCLYFQNTCAQACTVGGNECGANAFCDACATSSCPACNDCLAACVFAPPPP